MQSGAGVRSPGLILAVLATAGSAADTGKDNSKNKGKSKGKGMARSWCGHGQHSRLQARPGRAPVRTESRSTGPLLHRKKRFCTARPARCRPGAGQVPARCRSGAARSCSEFIRPGRRRALSDRPARLCPGLPWSLCQTPSRSPGRQWPGRGWRFVRPAAP